MDLPKDRNTDIHSEEFLRSLMRKQLRLSVACAAAFLAAYLTGRVVTLLFYSAPKTIHLDMIRGESER